nr:hypothetical protein [Paracoccus sp. MKU1]
MPEAPATIYVGIDVSKDKFAVAIASGKRRDEVLNLGTFENTPGSVERLLKKLSGRGDVSVCYEAGPTGYGLYRQVRAFGYECCVVAPSLTGPIRGQQNEDFSSRFANRHTPLPSHQTILTRSARFARNT